MVAFASHPTASNSSQSSIVPSRAQLLDAYYQEIQTVILSRQNPITGLLPASTAVNEHGDYTDAWVRDNVYSILAVWGLALAYRKLDVDQGRTYELEHSVIKLMRGLLFAMMRQAQKVEAFKVSQNPLDALHAKYDTNTGDTVVGDDQWGHLQLDATSLYLLMLAQMTTSGLCIIYNTDEVNFVQNLVYYIGRAYRTPDYGIWERGNKINHGNPELNASSVGMAKAALEAMNNCDLFGVNGSQASVVHILLDEIARTRTTLHSLLPRESSSKEVDAALLSVIGFPAFAVEDAALCDRTRHNVIHKLQGTYGCKRFLRDGHQTVIEDVTRLHYEPWELQQFQHIECEWPLFFTYLMLDALFRGDRAQAEDYHQKLQPLFVERNGCRLLPELYYVPEAALDAERHAPQSQPRLPNANVPLVWAQSLYYLAELLREDLITPADIDPLGRRLGMGTERKPLVQIALLAEDEDLQARLATYGIATQTPNQVSPIQVRRAEELSAIYYQIGRNDKLKLTGRPIRRLRSLTTSRIFRICGETIVFLPSFLDPQQFYLTLDYHFLVAQIKGELVYIQRHWFHLGRPTLTLLLTHAMFEDAQGDIQSPVLGLLKELRDGQCNGVAIKLGNINQFILTAGTERIDFVHEFEFSQTTVQDAISKPKYLISDTSYNLPLSNSQEFFLESETNIPRLLTALQQSCNIYEQIDVLTTLSQRCGLDFDTGFGGLTTPVTVADLLDEVYEQASQLRLWSVIRRAAGLLNKVDIGLAEAVTTILIRGKQISVGKAYSEASLIDRPMSPEEVMSKIEEFCGNDVRERPLTQEILIYLSVLIKTEPRLFDGLLTLRAGYLILMLTSKLARELNVTRDEAYEALMQLSPFDLKTQLVQVLAGYDSLDTLLFQQESLHFKQQQPIQWVVSSEAKAAEAELEMSQTDWWHYRQREGALNRVPKGFYPKVWQVMQHCKGLVIGDKLDRRNRLDSRLILAEMTPGEKNFALRIEHLLNKIQAPEYRQANIEALMELAAIVEENPDLQIDDYIVLDVLIGHGVRLAWLDRHPAHAETYDQFKGMAWRSFYESSPSVGASFIAKALQFLMELGQSLEEEMEIAINESLVEIVRSEE
jgi:phosphorylase kinase alpha/beta subunit